MYVRRNVTMYASVYVCVYVQKYVSCVDEKNVSLTELEASC